MSENRSNQFEAVHGYPRSLQLRDKRIDLRLMRADEPQTLLGFVRSLPEEDLLFLAIDLTKEEAAEAWGRSIASGRTVTVLAELDGQVVGHGSLNHNALLWTRHLGELQLLVGREFRGLGLGQLLAQEVYVIARRMGLLKIIARMAADQRGAMRVFEGLGFHAEALLADYVIDRRGVTHDLIVMSIDLTGLTD